jgi:hypothetical protein
MGIRVREGMGIFTDYMQGDCKIWALSLKGY